MAETSPEQAMEIRINMTQVDARRGRPLLYGSWPKTLTEIRIAGLILLMPITAEDGEGSGSGVLAQIRDPERASG
ncbi:MAG: hypothetical protein M3N39_11390 [Pseudomonadota bacterium]|nr:hypothetical protein [Pseudomonadota bacterium]